MNFIKQLRNGFLGDTLALGAGASLTLAFAPFHIFPLAILSTALLLCLWLKISPARAFLRGWLFGLGLFSTGVYWVYISIHTFGAAPIYSAAFIAGGFICILALFPAISGYLLNRYFPQTTTSKLCCAFPAIWLLIEWVRSVIFSGFPWLTLGYSQIDSPLRGYAPIFSVYGVSLAVLITSGLLANFLLKIKSSRKNAYFSLVAIIFIWISGAYLNHFAWTKPFGEPIKVSLVQGNIPEDTKWSMEMVRTTLARYSELSKNAWDSNIVIWPESAIPTELQDSIAFLAIVDHQAKKHHTTFITGIPVKNPNADNYYNSIITLGDGSGTYSKHRLVPFGEYLPYRDTLQKILNFMKIPNVTMSDFIADKKPPQPLLSNGIKILPFICYEIAFPEQVNTPDGDINMLLTITNDAWFGHSIAQAQHLEMAQMRALELRRPILFVANDGITAIITPAGKIQSAAPTHEAYVLTDTVQPIEGRTPWQIANMDPILFLVFLLLAFAIYEKRTKAKLAIATSKITINSQV